MKGWSRRLIDYQLQHLNELKGFMPPFVGTEEERQALAAWLASLNPMPRNIEMPPVPGSKAEARPGEELGASKP